MKLKAPPNNQPSSADSIWRNQFLSAAHDLRWGYKLGGTGNQSQDLISAVPTQLLMDSMATRYDPNKIGAPIAVNLVLTDRGETVGIDAGRTVLFARVGQPAAQPAVTVTGPRRLILGLLFLKLPLAQLQVAGLKVEGDASAIAALQAALDPIPVGFTIAEP